MLCYAVPLHILPPKTFTTFLLVLSTYFLYFCFATMYNYMLCPEDNFKPKNQFQIRALCPSVFICAQMYAVNQGFVTSEAKGAHDGRRYPTMQILSKQFFTRYEADLI